MRRFDREIKSLGRMLEIMERCDCCRLGLCDGQDAYVVPLSFGFRVSCGTLVLYFHSACEGRRLELMEQCGTAAFEMNTGHALVTGDTACAHSFSYQSIVGRGHIGLLREAEEKIKGLEIIMSHYSDKLNWNLLRHMADKVAVIRLAVYEWTCKEH